MGLTKTSIPKFGAVLVLVLLAIVPFVAARSSAERKIGAFSRYFGSQRQPVMTKINSKVSDKVSKASEVVLEPSPSKFLTFLKNHQTALTIIAIVSVVVIAFTVTLVLCFYPQIVQFIQGTRFKEEMESSQKQTKMTEQTSLDQKVVPIMVSEEEGDVIPWIIGLGVALGINLLLSGIFAVLQFKKFFQGETNIAQVLLLTSYFFTGGLVLLFATSLLRKGFNNLADRKVPRLIIAFLSFPLLCILSICYVISYPFLKMIGNAKGNYEIQFEIRGYLRDSWKKMSLEDDPEC